MKSDLELRIEMTEALYRFCLSTRKMRNKPELAGVAAEREMQFKNELEVLRRELALVQTPELAMAGK